MVELNYNTEVIDEKCGYYVDRINSNPIFGMVESDNPMVYDRHYRRLLEDTFNYQCIKSCKRNIDANGNKDIAYGDFALELISVVKACLAWYDPQVGPFINLFNFAFAKELKRRRAMIEGRPIVKDRADEIPVRNYLRMLGLVFADSDITLKHIKEAARELDISEDRVEEIIRKKRERIELPQVLCISEEEEIDIIEESCPVIGTEELYMCEHGDIESLIDKAQAVYDDLRASQREIVSMCFTADLCSAIDVTGELVQRYPIIDTRVIDFYDSTGKVPQQKAIAAELGKEATAVCRVYSSFKSKLENTLEL